MAKDKPTYNDLENNVKQLEEELKNIKSDIATTKELLTQSISDQSTTEGIAKKVFQFQILITNIQAKFLAIESDDIDATIIYAQRQICEFFGTDRSALWQGSKANPQILRLSHLCTLDEIPPVPDDVTTNVTFPWFTEQLLRNQIVVVRDVLNLPAEASTDKANLIYYGDKSTLAIPFITGEHPPIFGALSFAATTKKADWLEDIISECQLIAQVFSSALARKKYECELKIAKEKAEESDRLKTAFLQNISHEIRTPLNAISGFSGLLIKPEIEEEKRKEFVKIIRNSSKQLLSIVTDILTISALETNQEKTSVARVCINTIIEELNAIFKQQALQRNITLLARQPLNDKQSEVYTDKTKITQILTNLLTNALKFTHKGSIEFGYNLTDNELEFYVKDTGIGIRNEFHKKIFERFMQADKSINILYGGTGLGLAISKSFTELLGGKIWVKSEFEKGSMFFFTIPYKSANEKN